MRSHSARDSGVGPEQSRWTPPPWWPVLTPPSRWTPLRKLPVLVLIRWDDRGPVPECRRLSGSRRSSRGGRPSPPGCATASSLNAPARGFPAVCGRPRRCSCQRRNLRSVPASTSRPGQLIAGFEVTINCRFWVSTEARGLEDVPLSELAAAMHSLCPDAGSLSDNERVDLCRAVAREFGVRRIMPAALQRLRLAERKELQSSQGNSAQLF